MTVPDQDSFSPRTVLILIASGVIAFAGAAYFMIFGDSGRTADANAFSKSAIGHQAFVELLRRREIAVIVSRHDSAAKADNGALLILAEPHLNEITKAGDLPHAGRTLLVLPKWRGQPSEDNPGWVDGVALWPGDYVEDVLNAAVSDAALHRPASSVRWNPALLGGIHRLRPGHRDNERLWNRIRGHNTPVIDHVQLIRAPGLTPLVASADGILVGGMQTGQGWLFVISDPDLLSNHGLGRGDNAALLLDALSLFRPDEAPVVIDETMHGFRLDPSLWRKIFELPFLAATILAMASVVVLLWASTSRFGAPLPASPRRDGGEAGLIENAVDLLTRSDHGVAVARRYPAVVLREVTQRLHAPRRLSDLARLDWLDRIGAARGVEGRYSALHRQIEEAAAEGPGHRTRVLQAVQRMYQWKQEMLDGSGRHPSD